jgi:glycosyltransferase involved in cell wall biosynthesis
MAETQHNGAPTLSVTVLNYNYGQFLPACLDSILGQTYRDFELIIIDDCSTDDSLKVLKPYAADSRVRIVAHEENAGFHRSLIEGTEALSRGRFLSVISADDLVRRPEAFERQMTPLLNNPAVVLSFTAFDRFYSDNGEIDRYHHSLDRDALLKSDDAFRRFLTGKDVWPLHSGTIVRKTAYDACGGYPRDIKVPLDFALFAMISLEGDVAYCAEVMYGYRIHRNQMSRSLAAARINTEELLRIIERACARAEERGWNLGALRRDAVRCQLGGAAVHDAYTGHERLALTRCVAAFTARPRYTLTSREVWAAALRALLGRRGFKAFRMLTGPVRTYGSRNAA